METITLKENLLLEKIDEQELREIAKAFDKIDAVIQNADLPAIKEPISRAREEITDMVTGATKGIKRFFKGFRQKKVLSNVVGTQIQVLSLFRAMPSIMTLAGPEVKDAIKKGPAQMLKTLKPADYTNAQGEREFERKLVGSSPTDTTVRDIVGGQSAQRMEALIAKSLKPGMLEKTIIDPDTTAQQIMDLKLQDFSDLVKRASGVNLRVPVAQEDVKALQDAASTEGDSTEANKLSIDLKKGDASSDALKHSIKALEPYGVLKPEITNLIKNLK